MRKLLKRKLKILPTEKLKSWSPKLQKLTDRRYKSTAHKMSARVPPRDARLHLGRSSLGRWALMQMGSLEANASQLHYPNNYFFPRNTPAFSHRKLLDLLTGGSMPLWGNGSFFGANRSPLEADMPKTNWPHLQLIEKRNKNIEDPSVVGRDNLTPNFPMKSSEKSTISKISSANILTQEKVTPIHHNWKCIYSLDQLMRHQFDTQYRKVPSAHLAKLIQVRKLAALYGKLSKKQRQNLTYTAGKVHNVNLLPVLLESRLDVVAKQCFIFGNLRCAQSWIGQGKVLVNGRPVTSSSYTLKGGDLVSIQAGQKSLYRKEFFNAMGVIPKERKFMCSHKLSLCLHRWARMHNFSRGRYLQAIKELCKERNTGLQGFSVNPSYFKGDGLRSIVKNLKVSGWNAGFSTMSPLRETTASSLSARMGRWLTSHRWPRKRLNNWKFYFRKRFILSTYALLGEPSLAMDGLNSLRWARNLVRRKSNWLTRKQKRFTLYKPLHLEISHRTQSAIFLYSPQKLIWPCMIDFRKI